MPRRTPAPPRPAAGPGTGRCAARSCGDPGGRGEASAEGGDPGQEGAPDPESGCLSPHPWNLGRELGFCLFASVSPPPGGGVGPWLLGFPAVWAFGGFCRGKGKMGLGWRSQQKEGSVQHLMQSELLQIQNWSVPNPVPLQVPEEPHHSPRAKLLAWPQLPFLPTHSPSCPCQSSAPEPPASALCRLPSSVPPQPLALARPHSLPVNPHPGLRPGLLPASSSPHSELTLFLPYFQPSCGFPVPQLPGLAFIYIYLFMYLFNCTRS